MLTLARLVRLAAGIAVGILLAAILLRVLGANPSNDVVSAIHDAGRWLAGPFRDVFSIHDAKLRIVVNWGLAAVVYAAAAAVIAGVLVRGSGVGPLGERRPRPRRLV